MVPLFLIAALPQISIHQSQQYPQHRVNGRVTIFQLIYMTDQWVILNTSVLLVVGVT